jgi:predicted transcriptional regulator
MLENIFASKTQSKILRIFFNQPNQSFYQRQIAKTAGESLGSTQYEIKRLLKIGMISAQKSHNKVFYSLNKNFYLYSDIRNIFFKTAQRSLK